MTSPTPLDRIAALAEIPVPAELAAVAENMAARIRETLAHEGVDLAIPVIVAMGSALRSVTTDRNPSNAATAWWAAMPVLAGDVQVPGARLLHPVGDGYALAPAGWAAAQRLTVGGAA